MEEFVYWQHPKKIAEGWLVIDQLINGVSGGGIFMHSNTTLQEVADLARNMTYKNKLNKIPFGGAKAGIRFDHKKTGANEVLKDFLAFCKPYLINHWSTGADLNTDGNIIDNIVKSFNIDSSFFALGQLYAKKYNIHNQSIHSRLRVSLPINQYFTLEQAVVGYSMVKIISHLASEEPLKLVLQGFGKIGSSFAFFAEQNQLASIVAICDVTGSLIEDAGLSIAQLLQLRKNNPGCDTLAQLYPLYVANFPCQWLPSEQDNYQNLLTVLKVVKADIASFCANRYAVTPEVLDTLMKYTFSSSQEKFLICGANLPFSAPHLAEKACADGIVCLPSWFTSSGNSLLYAEALSVNHIDGNWALNVLDKIVLTLITILESSLSKLNYRPNDLYRYLSLTYCKEQLEHVVDL